VLVAEDNRFNQRLLATVFEAEGAVVVLANDGQEALHLCDGHCFDVVVLDLHMPKLDGLQVTQSLRSCSGVNANVPIIILTADVFQQQPAIIEHGANAICYKPIDEEQLIDSVQLLSGAGEAPGPRFERNLIRLPSDQIENEVNRQLQCIAKALAAEDLAELKQQSHQLLGVIGLSGVDSIYSHTQTLNTAVLSGDIAAINVQFERLLTTWSNVEI
jgi:two-component system sensor histidine kinase BarA